MAKIELGFQGERFLYIPNPKLALLEDSPLVNDLYIYSIGYFSRAAHHYISRPKGCDEFLFLYCKEGCGWIELYGSTRKLATDQFIILPKNIPHRYWADEKTPWTIYWIHFKGSKAPYFSANFDKPTSIQPSALSRIEERLDMFEEIFFILNEEQSIEHMHYANLCFAHFLGSFLFINVYRNNFRHKVYAENVMKRVIHFMNENIEKNLMIKDFTQFCGYSSSYFYRMFIKETGHAPMEYFILLKIEKSRKLLIQTDMKINQIAYKLGFKEAQSFSRAFAKYMGMSATEFRKQNLKL